MKVAELISELEQILERKGDLEVKFEDRTGYRYSLDLVKVKMRDAGHDGTPEIVLSK